MQQRRVKGQTNNLDYNTSDTLGRRHVSRNGGRAGRMGKEHPQVRQGESEHLVRWSGTHLECNSVEAGLL